jgi:hypothetical protein
MDGGVVTWVLWSIRPWVLSGPRALRMTFNQFLDRFFYSVVIGWIYGAALLARLWFAVAFWELPAMDVLAVTAWSVTVVAEMNAFIRKPWEPMDCPEAAWYLTATLHRNLVMKLENVRMEKRNMNVMSDFVTRIYNSTIEDLKTLYKDDTRRAKILAKAMEEGKVDLIDALAHNLTVPNERLLSVLKSLQRLNLLGREYDHVP